MPADISKPGNVQTAGLLMIFGGIAALLVTLSVGLIAIPYSLCLWTPVTIFGIVAGILNIVKGSQLVGECAPGIGVPTVGPVLLIINLLNCDVIAPTLGIITLVMLGDSSTRAWLEGNVPKSLPSQMAPVQPHSPESASLGNEDMQEEAEPEIPDEPVPPQWKVTEQQPAGDAPDPSEKDQDAWNNWQVPSSEQLQEENESDAPASKATVAIPVGPATDDQDPLELEPWDVNIDLPKDEES